jgi:hypothetical protein
MVKIYFENRLLWSKVKPANTIWSRLIGLLKTPELDPEQGLLIWPCRQVHGFHMKYAIDVIFISSKMSVISVCTLDPGRVSPLFKNAHYALEVTAGQARLYGVRTGDSLFIDKGNNSVGTDRVSQI